MRIKILLLTSMLIFVVILAGCSLDSMQEPPEISIHIGDKEIEYVSAKNKWNGSIYDREDTFITILKEQNEIPVFENGSIAEIVFTNNPPDEFIVMDMLINEEGNQIYTDKEIKNIPIESNDGKYSFGIDYHLASALSSFYEPGKTDIRGFRMIASWGENECEYAFVVRTYTKNLEEQTESESSENEIDRSEYLTGEIITDGDYSIIEEWGFDEITFIPDEESLIIIKDKFGEKIRYNLAYNDLDKVSELPDKLGIYKVKVKVDKIDNYGYLVIDDILLTDKIGTVSYEGKTFEGNDLDDTVEVKDRINGLIVNHVVRNNGGIVVGFVGEIESEGFYFIDTNENSMYGPTGTLHIDEEYLKNFPTIYGERTFSNVWFSDSNELFDEVKNHSLFGRGKFKTSGYALIYNYGMGYGPARALKEIIYLDKEYENLFAAEDGKAVGYSGISDDFIIVSYHKYDNNFFLIEREYYYINKENPEKILIPVDFEYYYSLKEVVDDNEFILSTEGYPEVADTDYEANPHEIKCTITSEGILTERIN